ncbi:ribonuclease h1 h2 small subunit [Ophiostoma piceae UAMH 11346]|uniref:Ribonuclease h1 h2 small subunit n=1 Tax=Ophiostoma piceae (strain UAMH 11346) TaxID=1262450 RepID=S3CCW5_OPHP1|nr:ribonuclease h1 h2 small subunit [Ophiostoma piceae UAMH 11346]
MTQPMLEIKPKSAAPDSTATHTTPQLLPCRINHDGPVTAADAFWQPTVESESAQHCPNYECHANRSDGKNTAYFRGRKLHGQAVKLPADYRGVVGVRRESPREQAAAKGTAGELEALDAIDVDATRAEQDAHQQRLDTGSLEVLAEFEEVVVWGHQSTADATTDPYVRGMDEWLALSDKIHSYE